MALDPFTLLVLTAAMAASPVCDSSFVEKGRIGGDLFQGLATVRCSELGYWNFFAPILDYTSAAAYADSIQSYIDSGMIRYPSELYYPIRLKNFGPYSLEGLKEGISHIELRMVDLNPLVRAGIDERTVLESMRRADKPSTDPRVRADQGHAAHRAGVGRPGRIAGLRAAVAHPLVEE